MNCLDAETLAAWFDGGLSGAALEDVRSHVAGCARCQALVGAMGRTRSAVPAPQAERSPRWWLAWAVPAAAAATAVAIWVAVPRPATVAVNPSSSVSLQKQEVQPPGTSPAVPPAQTERAAPPARAATPALQDRARSADAAASPAAPPAAANEAAQAPGSVNEAVSVRSAAPTSAVAEKRDEAARDAFVASPCGPMWPAPPADIAGQITAGSAPSTDICWIVGRAGTVLRSIDHQTWQRVNIPQAVDLSGVTATDARTATIMAADGRTFSTADGGMTWVQR